MILENRCKICPEIAMVLAEAVVLVFILHSSKKKKPQDFSRFSIQTVVKSYYLIIIILDQLLKILTQILLLNLVLHFMDKMLIS